VISEPIAKKSEQQSLADQKPFVSEQAASYDMPDIASGAAALTEWKHAWPTTSNLCRKRKAGFCSTWPLEGIGPTIGNRS
jgi:hypothetical protein